ncbi:DUF4254 domain-containing protein [Siphonobacter sp. SORGH_AS_0500]|uniref:DUF4254 domain-containing protein n=1 Tax=Siphonobacter sp. SORGH_AS_0500 TaxID=1864824 RepID=UPI000CC568A4|nr:DUF4254 domain-containing protein [Siphonobacter sp. SORGH_AS_0500]MDR6196653.1 hypothetical protein [Siphonobacter sp. SORGH_AS_0500]PKK35418.1 hypothetical protein BWI96_17045 [Siphonobacter sp. SORGH_AS_0500]
MNAPLANDIFRQSINDYHRTDHVDTPLNNPYDSGTIESYLYHKNWIDTVQWHLEDLIRDPHINPAELVGIKRRIDASNQDRTDMVEKMDDWFMAFFGAIARKPNARLNSETPAWLLDRMSILQLKIYHFREQAERSDASEEHIAKAKQKLQLLLEQEQDLASCFDELLEDIREGNRYMKVYRQMKMYNDPALNPVLYQQK